MSGEQPEGIDFDKVHDTIKKIEDIISIQDLHIWAIDSKDSFLSCHVCIKKITKKDSDKLIKKINKVLEKKYDIHHSSIQIEKNDICNNNLGDND